MKSVSSSVMVISTYKRALVPDLKVMYIKTRRKRLINGVHRGGLLRLRQYNETSTFIEAPKFPFLSKKEKEPLCF